MCTICATLRPFESRCPFTGETLKAAFVESADAAAATDTAYAIAAGDTFSGTLTPTTDRDWVRISLAAGQSVSIALDGIGPSGVADPFLRLYDAAGNFVAQDDDSGPGLNSLVLFTPAAAGTFFIEAASFQGLTGGAYRITVSAAPAPPPGGSETLDAPAGTATPYAIALGGTFNGTLRTANDSDWVRIDMVAGQTYQIDLAGTGATPVRDTFLRLLDSRGAQVAVNDDSGQSLNSRLVHTATETGAFYIEAASSHASHMGGYTLQVTQGTPPPPPVLPVATIDQIADHLTSGFWFWFDGYDGPPRAFALPPGGLNVDISALTAEGQQLARWGYEAWTQTTGLAFNLFTAPPTGTFIHIRMDDAEEGAFATTTSVGAVITDAFINVDARWLNELSGSTAWFNTWAASTYIHEIGHALGLGHSGNYNITATFGVDNQFLNDSWQASVMSYFSQQVNTFVNATEALHATPMLADLVAIASLYGLQTPQRTGDTTYGDNSDAGGAYARMSAARAAGTLGDEMAWTIRDDGGIDTLDVRSHAGNQRVDLRPEGISDIYGAIGTLSIARGTVIENARTGAGNDTVIGNAASNALFAGAGNDSVTGGAGNDALDSGAGNDTVWGGDGRDLIRGEGGNDSLDGGADADMIAGGADADAILGHAGNDTLFGGAGNDTVHGGAGNDQIFGIDGTNQIRGEAGNDFVQGGVGRDTIEGGTGNDLLLGSLGDDLIFGETQEAPGGAPGAAGDSIFGGGGVDHVWGTGRDDWLYGGTGNDTVHGGAGNDRLFGIAGSDTLLGEGGNDTIAAGIGGDFAVGGEGDDLLRGGSGRDTFEGGAGNDTAAGAAGDDRLAGDGGNDTLWGGAGNDTIFGGTGVDRMAGGAGSDVFVFDAGAFAGVGAAADTISDFSAAQGDSLDFSGLGFAFIGEALFGGTGAAQLRYAAGRLQGDRNGDGVLDGEIVLLGAPALPQAALDLV